MTHRGFGVIISIYMRLVGVDKYVFGERFAGGVHITINDKVGLILNMVLDRNNLNSRSFKF